MSEGQIAHPSLRTVAMGDSGRTLFFFRSVVACEGAKNMNIKRHGCPAYMQNVDRSRHVTCPGGFSVFF